MVANATLPAAGTTAIWVLEKNQWSHVTLTKGASSITHISGRSLGFRQSRYALDLYVIDLPSLGTASTFFYVAARTGMELCPAR